MIIERLSDETRFTATEKKVIEFIQEHPRVVTNLSLDDLAAACFTSQASIIRLCKKLGTKGFAEFKVQLASELSLFAQDNREISVDIPIEPDSNSQEIAKTFYNLSRRAIESTRNSLDHIALQKAARLLAHHCRGLPLQAHPHRDELGSGNAERLSGSPQPCAEPAHPGKCPCGLAVLQQSAGALHHR